MPTPVPIPKTLENCSHVRIWFEPDGLTAITIWPNGPRLYRPVKEGQAIRELKPGDQMVGPGGEVKIVRSVEPQ